MRKFLTSILNLAKALTLYRKKERVEFSYWWFTTFVGIEAIILWVATYWLTGMISSEFQTVQFKTSVVVSVGCFLAFHLIASFFEFFFHRYVLHAVMWKSLRAFEAKHGEHHALTHVKPHNRESTEEVVVVLNKYPITVFEQIRSSAFPAYALITFVGIFAPIIALLQFTMPGLPWITTGLAAVIWSFYLYEVLHALWHENPTTSWKTWIELPIVGRLVKSVYGFHLIHHAHHRSNMAISGFFGLPVPDWIFGTYYVPEKLPLDNHMTMKRSDYPNPPPPCKLIAWLDSKVGKQGE